jgi:hypothetical protein
MIKFDREELQVLDKSPGRGMRLASGRCRKSLMARPRTRRAAA